MMIVRTPLLCSAVISEVCDGHLRLKSARKLGSRPAGDTTAIPVILCDEWSEAQVKAFRLPVNRSANWAEFDEELLALELEELRTADYDLSLTGFDTHEIDALLAIEDDRDADTAPPLPENPVSRSGDLWLCGAKNPHRVLCGDATSAEVVARLLDDRKPRLMITDPPYGIELDSEWRDRAGLNGCGPAEASYMKHRTQGHTKRRSLGIRVQTGRKLSRWCRASSWPTSGTPLSSLARCWTDSCGSASCITSRLSGIRDARF